MGPRGTPAAALALLALLAPAADREFRGKRVTLTEPPRSQLAQGSPVRPVGKEIRIGAAVFRADAEGGKLAVAVVAGASSTVPVVEGKPVRLSWEEGGAKKSLLLGFARDEAGAWTTYAAEAVRFEVAGEEIRLYDSDMDGTCGTPGQDGWSTGEAAQVIPLRAEFPLGPNLVSLRSVDPDGGRMVAALAPLAGSKSQVAATVAINRLRTSQGLPPVRLDDALSAGCTAHAKYLALNGWTGRTNPHSQNLGPKGASPEGAASAARSIVGGGAPDAAIEGFWRTYYHRICLMSPLLRRIGLNAEPPDLSVVDVAGGYGDQVGIPGAGKAGEADPADKAWEFPILVPADGSVGLPLQAVAEMPADPVTNFGQRGIPLMAFFPPGATVTAFEGVLEDAGRGVRLPVLKADPGDVPFVRGAVPEKPLHGKTWYRATFTWTVDGKPGKRAIRFRTQ